MHSSEILSPSLRDLDETLDEFEAASFQAAERLLGRLVYQLRMVCINRPLPLLHEAESQATI